MSTEITYDNIDRPYDDQLSRVGASSNKAGQPSFGNEQTNQYSNISAGAGGTSVTSGNMLGDMWITTFIRSKNWKPKERGFTINGAEGYAEFANVHISGELTASSGIIGGFTITSDELYSIADGNKTSLSSGFIAFSVGPEGHPTATILQSGKASFADIDITGGSISDATLDSLKAGSMPSIQGWTSDLVFSATNNTTVEWAAGDIELVDGTTYAIVAGNTGVMAASTYIYIDIDVSVTVLQKTTTASDSVGGGKILVAVAKNVTGVTKDATFQVFGGAGGISSFIGIENIPDDEITAAVIADNTITAGQILANTITSGEIAANTIEAGQIKANTITASEIAANTITSNEIAANTITASEIAANTITSNKIAANTITASQIAATTITAAQIVSGTITATQLSTNSVTAVKISVSTLSAITANLGTITAGSITSATYTSVAVGASSGRSCVIDGDSSKNIKFYYNNTLSGYIATSLHTSGEDEYMRIQVDSGRSLRFRESRIECNGDFTPDSDNNYTCGSHSDRWSDGRFEDINVDDLTVNDGCSGCGYAELNYLTEKQRDSFYGARNKKFTKANKKKWKEINVTGFEEGDVLAMKKGKLVKCKIDACGCVRGVSNKRGLPIIFGDEPIKVIGQVRENDFLVGSSTPGFARAWRKKDGEPPCGVVIGQADEDKFTEEKGRIMAGIFKR